ncbi:MAG: CHAP domain-containing protein, partial [Oscillospiraceae bacterium]|nr:CHAP domain-containing protein [Oscillospiraceae bacterium]
QEVSGSAYPWCCAFVWWVFREAGASGLFYGGKRTASCSTLLGFHKAQAVQGDYLPGDIIFFNFDGKKNTQHVGICEAWDGQYITTIDGNTAPTNEANGGAVMRRRRAKKYIVGAYRPAYEEDTMTQTDFDKMMDNYLERRGSKPASGWAGQLLAQARSAGITDGSRPQSFATREEVVTMILNSGSGK